MSYPMSDLPFQLANSDSLLAADLLAKVKTVDGAGSGLDADLWDGMHMADTTIDNIKDGTSYHRVQAAKADAINNNNILPTVAGAADANAIGAATGATTGARIVSKLTEAGYSISPATGADNLDNIADGTSYKRITTLGKAFIDTHIGAASAGKNAYGAILGDGYNVSVGTTITIDKGGANERQYVFVATLTGADGELLIGATQDESYKALHYAINMTSPEIYNYGGTAPIYSVSAANPVVVASRNYSTIEVDLIAKTAGKAANTIRLNVSGAHTQKSGDTLEGGIDLAAEQDRIVSVETLQYPKLYGKKIVCFGDSNTANPPPPYDYPSRIAKITGATTYNCAIGGTRMGYHPTPAFDAFCFYRLAASIASGNFSLQNTYKDIITNGAAVYNRLVSIDWSKIDYITVWQGTNDFTALNIDNPSDDDDVNYYIGALRYSLNQILTAYPNIKVILITPPFRGTDGSVIQTGTCDDYLNAFGKYLHDYVDALKNAANEYKTPCVDLFYSGGVNAKNWTYHLWDGVHYRIQRQLDVAFRVIDALNAGSQTYGVSPQIAKDLNNAAGTTTEQKIAALVNKNNEAWQEVTTFLNNWVQNTDANFHNLAYMKDALGFVHLRGMTKSGTIGQAIFTLPSGYRPSKSISFSANSNNAFGSIMIASNGNVYANAGSNAWFSLSGISFMAEV